MEQSELMEKLGKIVTGPEIHNDSPNIEDLPLCEPLPSDDKAFWKEQEGIFPQYASINAHSTDAVLAKELGNFPFWSGQESFLKTMESLYAKGSSILKYKIEV